MTVVLAGRPDGTTHREVALLSALPPGLRLIGGLAVMCRVGSPHRATVDLDALARGLERFHPTLARLAVTASGGGQYRFAGDLDLDVIDVAPDPAATLAGELEAAGPLTDLEVNVVCHVWAHDTATPLDVLVVDEATRAPLARADDRLVASAAGIAAMKASTIPLRASSKPEKRASDLYDLGRILVDGGMPPGALAELPEVVRSPIVDRIHGWFVEGAGRDRTYREVRRFDEPRLDLDAAADVAEALVG